MKKMPKQYEILFDDVILKIADEAKRIIPVIEELGERLEFEVDNHIVIIKRKEKDMMQFIWYKWKLGRIAYCPWVMCETIQSNIGTWKLFACGIYYLPHKFKFESEGIK